MDITSVIQSVLNSNNQADASGTLDFIVLYNVSFGMPMKTCLQCSQFSYKYSQNTPQSSPVREALGCVLWNQHLIDILPHFLLLFM